MTVSETPVVGRPRSFDEDAVLDALTALFWRKGYAQTSMADVVEASGVHKPSLYRVFGTKDEIFATVLHRYLDAQMATVSELIERCSPGADGVHEFLDGFAAAVLADACRNGCLLVMASNELSGTMPGYEDFAGAYRSALRERLAVLVTRALGEDTSDMALVDQRSELLTTFLAGFQVAVRAGASDEEIHRIIDSMHGVIDAWSLAGARSAPHARLL